MLPILSFLLKRLTIPFIILIITEEKVNKTSTKSIISTAMARNYSGSKGIGILNHHKQKRPLPDYINQMAARPSVQLSISIL